MAMNYNAAALYQQLYGSPEYAQLEGVEDEEEKKKRRMYGVLGNYQQQHTSPDPQFNLGYSVRTPSLFDMYYI